MYAYGRTDKQMDKRTNEGMWAQFAVEKTCEHGEYAPGTFMPNTFF